MDFYGSEISVSSNKLGVPHTNTGSFREANQFIAEIHGADQCRITHQGTTSNNKAIFKYLKHKQISVAVTANAHKSVLDAAGDNGVDVSLIPVYYDTRFESVIPSRPEDVALVLERNPQIGAVMVTTPTYEGLVADVEGIGEVCRRAGVLLILDRAWCHLPNKMANCADVMVKSTHKEEGAYQGGAVLLWREKNIDSDLMNECYSSVLSTSPNITTFYSVEECYRVLTYYPEKTIGRADVFSNELREAVRGIDGIELLSEDYLRDNWKGYTSGVDPWKIQLSLSDFNCTGYEVNSELQSLHRIIPEKSGPRSLTLISTIRSAQIPNGANLVSEGLTKILDKKQRGRNPNNVTPVFMHENVRATGISDALYGRRKRVQLDKAIGEICAEVVVPYPPGYAPIAPGQIITKDVVDFLKKIRELGGEIMASDHELREIKVLNGEVF